MRIPKSIPIYGQITKIKKVDPVEGIYGCYHRDTKEIKLDKNLKGSTLRSTLYHELGHGICDRLGLGQIIPPEIEELIVEGYANFLEETFEMKFRR